MIFLERTAIKLPKKILVGILCVCLSVMFAFTVSAAPTDTYNRIEKPGDTTDIKLSKEIYTAVEKINASSLGLETAFEGITDINCSEDGTVYLLCGEKSRVVVLNSDYTLKKEITVTDNEGKVVDFTGAMGIYSNKDNLYICDTNNSRILILNKEGVLQQILGAPEADMISDDFFYQPIKIQINKKGYIYVLSRSCYYGALLYTPELEFLGFYGANTVESNVLNTLSFLWDKLTSNDVKKSSSLKTLPYSFVDFDLDSGEYLVTATGRTKKDKNQSGQIRKITLNGSNILYKRSQKNGYKTSDGFNFLEKELVIKEKQTGFYIAQDIVAVACGEDDSIFVLDGLHGTVYLYDSESNLFGAFGGGIERGNQLGVFEKPVCMEVCGDDVVIGDSATGTITVFKQTEYGALLRKAQAMYLEGDYEESAPIWKTVLQKDSTNQMALRGLAKASYNQGDYKSAMDYAKNGIDYSIYDLAWNALLKQFLADYFILIIAVIVILVVGAIFFIKHLKRKETFRNINPKLKLIFRVPFHPFDSFNELKYKKLGSVKISIVITAVLYIAFYIKDTLSGFLYSPSDLSTYNSLYTLGRTVVLLLLWSVANWLVCAIFSGKGTFKEVFCATAYSLVPMIVYTFIRVALTNLLPLSASGFISALDIAVWIFTFFLLSIAIMTVHEYDFFKLVLTAIPTVFLMLLAVFVVFICTIMLAQTWDFITSVYEEIVYR